MFRKKILMILVCCAAVAGVVTAQTGSSNEFGAETNPAMLGFPRQVSSEIQLRLPDQQWSSNPYELEQEYALSLVGTGFGLIWKTGSDTRELTIANGVSLPAGFSAGTSGSFPSWDMQAAVFRIGAAWRPLNALQIGAMYRGESEGWSIHPAAGIRPLAVLPNSDAWGHRLGLYGFGTYNEGGGIGDWYGLDRVAAEVEPLSGIILRGEYAPDRGWTAGLELSFGYAAFGSVLEYRNSSEIQASQYRLRFDSAPRRDTVNTIPDRVIEYSGLQLISETTSFTSVGRFSWQDDSRPFKEFVDEIDAQAADPTVQALLFTNPVFAGDLGHIIELGNALQRFRETGKRVVMYFETVDPMSYAVAAVGSDEIYLQPSGSVMVHGYGTRRLYFKDMLKSFGIDPVGFESHPAKSAFHSYTESGMTDASRENIEAYLGSLSEEYLQLVEYGRGDNLSDTVAEIWDNAPYLTASRAQEAGLVDELLFQDEVADLIDENYPDAALQQPRTSDFQDPRWRVPELPRIAVVYATGTIMPGEGASGQRIGSKSLARQIRELREDDSVQAILLRVSSGGGSALASDVIAREVYKTTRGENPKPLIVSMGSVAASGGYYIAAYANHIFAYPTTITGSIGVTSFTIQLDRLLERLEITTEAVDTSESSRFLDPFDPLRSRDEEQMQEYIETLYDRFVNVVAEGRDMSRDEVNAVARGQIWTGTQAIESGLIDELGGLGAALEKAQASAGIDGPVEIFSPSQQRTFVLEGPAAEAADVLARVLLPVTDLPEFEELVQEWRRLEQLSSQGGLYVMPYAF